VKAGAQPIADTVDEVLKQLRKRYRSNRGTSRKVQAEAERLFRYLDSVKVLRWEDISPETVLSWCWAARKTNAGEYRRPEQATARNRQWAATAVFEAAEQLGLIGHGRCLVGTRIRRSSDSVPTRPLTEHEVKRVQSFADRGQPFSRRAVIVALALAGGTSSEIAQVRKGDLDLPNRRVWIGRRWNPLSEWGHQYIQHHLQIRPHLEDNRLLAVDHQIAADRRAHAVTVRLGEVISDSGLKGSPGVSARSIRLHTANRILRTQGLEAAAWFLGSDSLVSVVSALEYDWKQIGQERLETFMEGRSG